MRWGFTKLDVALAKSSILLCLYPNITNLSQSAFQYIQHMTPPELDKKNFLTRKVGDATDEGSIYQDRQSSLSLPPFDSPHRRFNTNLCPVTLRSVANKHTSNISLNIFLCVQSTTGESKVSSSSSRTDERRSRSRGDTV